MSSKLLYWHSVSHLSQLERLCQLILVRLRQVYVYLSSLDSRSNVSVSRVRTRVLSLSVQYFKLYGVYTCSVKAVERSSMLSWECGSFDLATHILGAIYLGSGLRQVDGHCVWESKGHMVRSTPQLLSKTVAILYAHIASFYKNVVLSRLMLVSGQTLIS